MLSIIVCSVEPERSAELRKNIEETIGEGVEYEFLITDNSTNSKPLAVVYNEAAARAKYPNLLFIHEDAGFITKGWYGSIAAKLAEEDCGVVGFAGSKMMFDMPGGWGDAGGDMNVFNLVECGKLLRHNCDSGNEFEEVVTEDGFCMFVRRDVWERFPFDEKLLDGFHCYDIDFALGIAKGGKRNWVNTQIGIFHNSSGNFDRRWWGATIRMYDRKWRKMLPMCTSDLNIDNKRMDYLKERSLFRLIKYSYLNGKQPNDVYVRLFKECKMSSRHFEHLLKYAKFRTNYYFRNRGKKRTRS